MPASLSLRSFISRSVYSAHFMDPLFWEPYIRQVCRQHSLECGQVSPGVPGSFPTFIVDSTSPASPPGSRVVIKFFGPLFDGPGSFCIEHDLARWLETRSLPIPSPAILAEGRLDPQWQYLVFEHIPGLSIGELRPGLSPADFILVSRQVGEYIHRLHTLPLDSLHSSSPQLQPTWEAYASFLGRQRLNCYASHLAWQDLPSHLLPQVEGFLLPVEQLVDFSAEPHLIHADLTADHLLGRMVDGGWQTLAIIDWGDAMTGNLLYELVALHLDLFQADRCCLHTCLEAYQLPPFYRHDFARKALNLVLLHQFPMPARVYQPYQAARDLQELADGLFER